VDAGGHFGPARVRAVRDVAADVRLVEIEPAAGARAYATGAHLDLELEVAGLPDIRSYSLVGDRPVDGAYRIAVKKLPESRGGSAFMHTLQPGAELSVSEPQSHFEIQYGRPEYLLVAGGIGITPMVGMAHALERHGRPFRLLYAARTRDQLAFVDELRALLGERLELFVSADGTRLDLEAEVERLHPEGELYLCGPLRLMDAARHAWRAQDRPPARLRFETFASSGRFAAEPFTVRVREREAEICVPQNQTMLAALRGAGVDMMWDCLRGECGLCAVDVVAVEGRLDHRDVFLSDEEQAEGRKLCTCVSRAVGGTITIDTGFRPDAARGVSSAARAASSADRDV
jgi:ferredoxin-NADP reductase